MILIMIHALRIFQNLLRSVNYYQDVFYSWNLSFAKDVYRLQLIVTNPLKLLELPTVSTLIATGY